MLEKIGLPAKPSLRGNNWVVDASHCQGCSSQFTFINRKHHCRRCGGLFCGSCTQQRMYLRGQGDAPVRICEPCKTLEEAARFEMRHGHKNRAGRGSTKLASNNEEDVLSKILGNGGNEPVSLDNDSVDTRSTMQRATSNASCSKSGMLTDTESTTPEELKQQAMEEKTKYKVLKAEGKPEEALRAFKRGKELERQATKLEIELRKNRKKALSFNTIYDERKSEGGKRPREKDDLATELKELGWSDLDLRETEKKLVKMTLEGELSTLLKEVSHKTDESILGTDKSEVVAIKKRALAFKREGKLVEAKEELKRAKILEKQIEEQELLGGGDDSDDEFTSLIRSLDIDKKDVFAPGNDLNHNFDFDHLLRVDDGPGVDFEVTDEDLDDPEMSAALQSLGWTEEQESQSHSQSQPSVDKEAILSEIQSLKREALSKKRAGNTAEALALLKKAKLLENDVYGSHEKQENDVSSQNFDRKTAPKSKLVIQRELLALKKKALALRREGRIDEADQELAKGKALEQQLEESESGHKVKPTKHVDFSAAMDIEDEGSKEDVTDTDMNDPSYLSLLQNLGWKEEDDIVKAQTVEIEAPKQEISKSKKSKIEIQRELLGLKRKSLALRRQGNIDEAEEVLQTAKGLEAQLAEIEGKPQETEIDESHSSSSSKSVAKKAVLNNVISSVSADERTIDQVFVDEKPGLAIKDEPTSIEQQILDHKRMAVSLKREGKLAEAKEELRQAKLLEKTTLNAVGDDPSQVPSTSNAEISDFAPVLKNESSPPKLSSRDRFKMQQESLGHKRQALKLRREGRMEEAEAEFELAKNLESQLEALTAIPESTKPVDDVGVEDVFDPQLLSALREIGIEGGGGRPSPEPVKPPVLTKIERPNKDRMELEEQIKAEKVKAIYLKRSGKQGEALDALKRAKLLEKRLNSLS